MKFRNFRLMNAADAQTSTGTGATPAAAPASSTLLPEGTPAVDTPTANADVKTDATQQTPAAEGEAKAEAKVDGEAAQPEKVVPEKYEFKAPEGVTLDPDALVEFEGIAKELKLTQDDAQKVADIGAKLAQKWDAKQAENIQAAAAEWAKAARTDKEFGGDKLTESLATGEKALDAFGNPALRTLLKESRLANHPEVIRFLVKAGAAISEDRMVTGGSGPAGAATSVAQRMYPNMNP